MAAAALIGTLLGNPAWSQSNGIQTDIFQNGAAPAIPGVTVPHAAPPQRPPEAAPAEKKPQPAPKQKAAAASKGSTKKGANAIPVAYDKALSAQIQKEFIERIKAQDPQSADEVAKQLEQRSAEDRFSDDLKTYGFSVNDMTDIATAHMLLMWMIANKANPPSPQMAQAVRSQIGRSLAQDPSLKNASARDRQLKAERIIYDALMRISAFNQLRRAGDDTAIQKFSDQTRSEFQQVQKIDLRSLKLSSQGFTQKNG